MTTEQTKHDKRIQRLIDQTARDLLKMDHRHSAKLEALKLRNFEEQRDFLAMLAPGMREQVEAAALKMKVDMAVDRARENLPSVERALVELDTAPEMADE